MRARLGRLASILIVLGSLFILSFWFEPRKTTYSCKTVSSCLGISNRHRYPYDLAEREGWVAETTLRDGTFRYERQSIGADPSIVFLVLTKDATSWSKDFRSQQRNIYDFLNLLVSTKLDMSDAALALLTSSREEYSKLTAAAEKFPLARVIILFKPEDPNRTLPYEQRHNPALQLQRRSAIATLRNYLMFHSVQDESHILWIDADVVEFSPNIVQMMIHHSETKEEAGIITARCSQHLMDNYDKNAWRVNSPQLLGVVQASDREAAVQKLVDERLEVPALLNGTNDDQIIPLDSVGGTILYIRSSLVRQGVVFPSFNIVGTEWGQLGWIGAETEGICYMAKSLTGGGCYILGGSHVVRHSDLG